MAKMIDSLLQGFRLHRLNRLRDQRSFLENYLPILVKAIRDREARRTALWNERAEAALRGPAILADIATPALAAEKQAALAKIEERYRWRFKALAQSKKRALERSADPAVETTFAHRAEELESRKRQTLTKCALRFETPLERSQSDLAAAKEAYRLKSEAVQAKAEKRLTLEKAKADRSVAAKTASYESKIALLGNKIEAVRGVLIARRSADADSMMPEDVLLSVRNLSMRFGGLLAVDNLSFDVRKGEIFGLIGPNGAGKTTIFNCITRFYRATAGEMLYRKNAVEVIRLNDYPVHDIIRQGIVRTFQNVELVWELSILDNLLVAAHTVYRTGFFGQLFHTPKLRREEEVMRAKAFSVLNTLGLLPYAFAIPYGLPYGILKKIELARTLMAHPRLIILDEPAAGLNDKETEELAVLIKKIRDDYHATIFLVEHDMGLVMDVCDTICAISFGKKLALGTPAEIQADKLVRSAYLGEES